MSLNRRAYFNGRAALAALLLSVGVFCGCGSIDDDRIPPAPVRIVFENVGQWNAFGIGGALDYRRFIKEEHTPSGFPYTALTYTGFGGVLLVGDINGQPAAYDLACPVECKQTVRVFVNDDNRAECPVCHSTYEIFTNHGYPLSGLAQERDYGLTVYKVYPGQQGEYMVVSR